MGIKGDVTGLKTLVFGGEPWIPTIQGYSGHSKSGVAVSSVGYGASRMRRKYRGNVGIRQANFYMETPAHQDYMMWFISQNEGKKFICHLSYDRPIVEPYVVQVIDDWDLSDLNAIDGELNVTLEIFGTRDQCLDDFIGPMYECVGSDLYCILDGMKSIVKAMPNA
jgi:hypothetical protein